MNQFTINEKLPSLNDYINECRTNKYKAANFKRNIENLIGYYITLSLNKGTLKPTQNPIVVHFKWHEKTKRRDADNVASAKKFVLDALQKYKVIPNDSRKYVKGFHDEIIDDTADYVEVVLIELLPM